MRSRSKTTSIRESRNDHRHDHRLCVATLLATAETLAQEHGFRLTPRRREVLKIVAASHRPVGAYDVLAVLTKSPRNSPPKPLPAPPTVYRALDFLLKHGLVHRIDSWNAYIACFRPGHLHRTQFFLCESCRRAVELADDRLDAALTACTKAAGFAVRHEIVEVAGLCRACRPKL